MRALLSQTSSAFIILVISVCQAMQLLLNSSESLEVMFNILLLFRLRQLILINFLRHLFLRGRFLTRFTRFNILRPFSLFYFGT